MSSVRSLYVEPEAPTEGIHWPALAFNDVFKIFRSGPVETVALRGLDLRVDPGELIAVLGPSGCGKSTMLALGAALDEPSAGEVRAGEQSLGLLDEPELARYRARAVALVLQRENLWPALSAEENVMIALQLAGRPQARRAAAEALHAFGLGGRARQRAGSLSGGEPTGELDGANERVVLDAFRDLRTSCGCAVVLVTHSSRVAGAADRVVEMRDGRVVG